MANGKKSSNGKPPAKSARKSAAPARSAGGKKMDPAVRATAEQNALEGLKERTEEGHLAAGRTPPSQKEEPRRSSGAARKVEAPRSRIDHDLRDYAPPVTED